MGDGVTACASRPCRGRAGRRAGSRGDGAAAGDSGGAIFHEWHRPGAKPLAVRNGTVRFEDVWFHYDERREILRGVSFEVPAGRTVAVVGP